MGLSDLSTTHVYVNISWVMHKNCCCILLRYRYILILCNWHSNCLVLINLSQLFAILRCNQILSFQRDVKYFKFIFVKFLNFLVDNFFDLDLNIFILDVDSLLSKLFFDNCFQSVLFSFL